jgi:uncharacterized membrane protein
VDDREIRGPLDFGQTLDAMFKLLVRCYRPLLITTLVIAVPIAVLTAFSIDAVTTSYDVGAAFRFDDKGVDYNDETTYTLIQLASTMLQSIVPGIVLVLGFDLVLRRARGDETATLGGSIRKSVRHWLPLTVASVLGGLGILVGFAFCVIPGLLLMVVWMVAIPALLDESLSGTEALGRSQALVANRWWATFGRYLTGALIGGIAGNLIVRGAAAIGAVAFDSTSTTALAVLEGGYVIATAITTPLVVCLITVIYIDLKARKGAVSSPGIPEAGATEFRGFAPPSAGA